MKVFQILHNLSGKPAIVKDINSGKEWVSFDKVMDKEIKYIHYPVHRNDITVIYI